MLALRRCNKNIHIAFKPTGANASYRQQATAKLKMAEYEAVIKIRVRQASGAP
jgi:hypothetical protein